MLPGWAADVFCSILLWSRGVSQEEGRESLESKPAVHVEGAICCKQSCHRTSKTITSLSGGLLLLSNTGGWESCPGLPAQTLCKGVMLSFYLEVALRNSCMPWQNNLQSFKLLLICCPRWCSLILVKIYWQLLAFLYYQRYFIASAGKEALVQTFSLLLVKLSFSVVGGCLVRNQMCCWLML